MEHVFFYVYLERGKWHATPLLNLKGLTYSTYDLARCVVSVIEKMFESQQAIFSDTRRVSLTVTVTLHHGVLPFKVILV